MELHKDLSKTLSYYLRHHPEDLGLNMSLTGWVEIDELVVKSNGKFTRDILKEIAETDKKKRYSINETGKFIRARYGHSVAWVKSELNEAIPNSEMYHGTSKRAARMIQNEGILSMSRNCVHLTTSKETAINTALRHTGNDIDDVVIYKIDFLSMLKDGFKFYNAGNEVWLTDVVPVQYITRLSSNIACK